MPSLIAPADAFRVMLHARLLARYDRRFKFVDKITSYYWFQRWKSLSVPRPVHAIADETLKAFRKLIREGKIRLLTRSEIPPAYIDPMDCALGELHVFNQILTIDAQRASPARVYKYVFCEESDVKKVARESEGSLIAASDEEIRDAITAVYDAGAKPNINQLPDLVESRLKARGLVASGNRIKNLGKAPKFKLRRRMPGQKRS